MKWQYDVDSDSYIGYKWGAAADDDDKAVTAIFFTIGPLRLVEINKLVPPIIFLFFDFVKRSFGEATLAFTLGCAVSVTLSSIQLTATFDDTEVKVEQIESIRS